MSQDDFGTINPATKSGTALASDLNDWRDTLHSLHSGSSRPSYATAGLVWLYTGATPWVIRIFDGSDDIDIGTVNATSNTFTVTLNDSAVTTGKIDNGAVTVAKLATVVGNAGKLVAYNSSGVPTVVSAGTDTYPLVSNGTGLPAFEQLATNGIANSAVTVAKISAAGSTSGQVLTSTGSGTAPSFQDAAGGFDSSVWNNVTGSRAHTTSYQNTRGKPIQVGIVCRSTSSSSRQIEVSSNGSTWLYIGSAPDSTHVPTGSYFIVPDDWYYRINGAANIYTWLELY